MIPVVRFFVLPADLEILDMGSVCPTMPAPECIIYQALKKVFGVFGIFVAEYSTICKSGPQITEFFPEIPPEEFPAMHPGQ